MAVTGASSSASKATPSTYQNTQNKNKNKNQTKTTNSKKTIKNTETKKQNTTRSSTRTESGNAQQKQLGRPSHSSSPSKRKKSPGVRVIHGRIHDPENGKTCHQCRQKTVDFAVSCKNQSENKQCNFHFCHICLLNRYGEKAEEMAALGDWKCPKCRGICNCSQCMKKRGCCPTGRLVHAAKAFGFSSVSEMLQLKDSEKVSEDVVASPKNDTASKEEGGEASTRKHWKENGFDEKSYPKSKQKSNGDDKRNENSQTKRLRKNDGSEKEATKISKDAGVSLKKLTSSKKELATASNRRCKRNYSLDGESDSKLQPKPLQLNGDEKDSRNGQSKKLRQAGAEDEATFTVEKNPKKCRISKEVPCREEKTCKRGDGGQLKKMKLDKQGPKKNHVRPNKIEDNEAKMTNEGAAKYNQVNGSHKHQKKTAEVQGKGSDVEIPLPQGIELTNVANIGLPAEDIGYALQFLEFCEAFGKVLDLKKGQPECLLRELARGRSSRWSQGSLIVRFHIKLLSMMQNDSGKGYSLKIEGRNSWLQALSRYISESQYQSKELLADGFNLAIDGYGELSSSKKLRILNFLCDEALGTAELRSWIDEQNLEFVEEEKKAKGKVLAEREKERDMKMKLQDEVARAILIKNGSPLSVSEHQDLVSKIKAEVAQTLAETLQAKDTLMKKNQRSDAVRSEPILLDGNGRIFWKLRGFASERDILLQDIGKGDSVTFKERWSSYNIEEAAIVEKYVSRRLEK